MTVNGEFYIDNIPDDFYLREAGAWQFKGRLVRADVLGFYADGPFANAQRFTLAPGVNTVHYSPTISPTYSKAFCRSTPLAPVDVVFTDDLAAYLALGERAIMTAHWEPGEVDATLTFLDAVILKHTPVFAVFPTDNDTTFAIVSIYMGGRVVS